jgi:hypothetical protein
MLLSSAITLRNVHIVKSFQLALSLSIRWEGVAPCPQCNSPRKVKRYCRFQQPNLSIILANLSSYSGGPGIKFRPQTGYSDVSLFSSFFLVKFVIWVVRLLFVLFCALFVCKCVLPPGDNPIAVNKYIIIIINDKKVPQINRVLFRLHTFSSSPIVLPTARDTDGVPWMSHP